MATAVTPSEKRDVSGLTRRLEWAASRLSIYSDAAARLARVVVIISVTLCFGAVVANVFTRYVLDYGILGWDEFASFAFLWTIWMGVSLAVRHDDVTVITLLRDRGPSWWRRSVTTFSGLSLVILLIYCVIRSTQYATSQEVELGTTTLLGLPKFYGAASMTVGYILISVHYVTRLARAAARLSQRGREALPVIVSGLAGGLVIAVIVWLAAWTILQVGGSPLIALGIVFVALTLAGNPIIFMLSIVGIVAVAGFAGLSFYPNPDILFPFRTTQTAMGLSGFTELTVVLMFLIVAEVMNASGMSDRLIAFAASLVGHLRGGMAYVCQLTSAMVSGISGSAQGDAAVMTPLLVPAMEKEGYPKDVAAAVVAGASLKGPVGPISFMYIIYGAFVADAETSKLLVSGFLVMGLLLVVQAATVYLVARRLGFSARRRFAGREAVKRTGTAALPVLLIPVIIIGGITQGVFNPAESGAAAAAAAVIMALFLYGTLSPRDLPRVLTAAGIETGIVMLLVGDSAILANTLQNNNFGPDLLNFITGLTDNKYVFLLVVNVLLLLVGIFVEPLPALFIFAPFLAEVAAHYGVDPTQFGLIVVLNLVLALIHPPVGLVLFLVSSVAKVPVERLSIVIIPWLLASLVVLLLITYLPANVVLVAVNHGREMIMVIAGLVVIAIAAAITARLVRAARDRIGTPES